MDAAKAAEFIAETAENPIRITLAQLRAEMARLTVQMMKSNATFLQREKELREEYGHDQILMLVRMNEDRELANASATSNICARMATACASVIQAELAYKAAHMSDPIDVKPVDYVQRRPK